MIYIWKGLGPVAALIPVCSLFLSAAIHLIIFGRDGISDHRDYLIITWGMISTVATWRIGRRMNRTLVRVTDADGNTTERWEAETHHSLYMIPVEYWAMVYLAVTLLVIAFGAPEQ